MSEPWVCADCGATLEELNCKDCDSLEGLTCQNCGAIQLIGVDAYKIILDILEITIKNDREYCASILRVGFSAIMPDPLNLLCEAPTSEGKTYPIVIITNLFPRKHVWLLGGLSPTALRYDHGILVDIDTGEELQEKIDDLYLELEMLGRGKKNAKERRDIQKQIRTILENSCSQIDLDGIIIIFLDNPHQETMNRLRPILSHDVWDILYKVTDRRSKGSRMEQMKTKLVGWPSAIATVTKGEADKDIWNQIVSRFITVSPKQDKTKYREAVRLSALKHGLPQPILNKILQTEKYEWARKAVEKIWIHLSNFRDEARALEDKKTPSIFWLPFVEKVGEEFPANIGRHMRDSNRFGTNLYMGAAINVFARPTIETGDFKSIIVVRQDYERAYDEFFSEERKGTIFTGLSSNIINFFNKVVVPLWPVSYVLVGDSPQTRLQEDKDKTERGVQGIEMAQLVKGNISNLGKSLSSDTLRKDYLGPLERAGLMDKTVHPTDKRKNLHIVLKTDVTDTNRGKKGISKDPGIFTLEYLKEALNDIKQIAGSEMDICIRAHTGEEISVEELYEKYYAYNISEFDPSISPSTKTTPKAKTGEKIEGKEKPNKTPLNLMKPPRKIEAKSFKVPRPNIEDEMTIVQSLINEIEAAGEVEKLWLEEYLERKGIPRKDAENIIPGLIDAGKIEKTENNTWRVKK